MEPHSGMDLTELNATAKLLLEHNARIDASVENGTTVLADAAERCRVDIVKLLLELGANPHKQDADGFTALDYMAEGNGGCAGNKPVFEKTKNLLLHGLLPATL
ncbi:Ank1 [Symbiodinium sp. CCMP2592]|nr:Ank1 [Symbiodinium sp. CCMP2592]